MPTSRTGLVTGVSRNWNCSIAKISSVGDIATTSRASSGSSMIRLIFPSGSAKPSKS